MPDGPAKEAARRAWALWQGGAPFGAPRIEFLDDSGRVTLRLPNGGGPAER